MPLSCARLEGRQDAVEVRGIVVNFSGSGALFIAALGIQSVLVFSLMRLPSLLLVRRGRGWGSGGGGVGGDGGGGGADFSALELVARAME